MSTTKSEERKSRRSSILKAPKARQPLQNVELNASIVENSPATSSHKIKRRVSFAEKKHVKEFCDSMEQGTVWDSTYEENELSHRNSQSSNDENTATVEFPNESSKSHPRASIAGTSDESGLKSRPFSSSTENRSISDLNPTPSACEPAIDDSVFGTAPTRIPYPMNHFGSIKARRSLSVSECFAEGNASERKSSFRARAETCPGTIDSRTGQALTDGRVNLESAMEAGEDGNDVVPMEETMIGEALVEPRTFCETVPRTSILAFVDESPISAGLEILSAGVVDSKLVEAIPSARMVDSKLVEAIPSARMVDLKVDEEVARIAKNSVEHEKFTIFHDTSMEITGAVSNLVTARPAKSLDVESGEDSSSVATEITRSGVKTLEFRDTSSKTVPGYSISNEPAIPSTGLMVDSKLDEGVARIAKNFVEHEKFTIFQDTSMEITGAVSNIAMARPAKSLDVECREDSSSVATEITRSGVKTLEFREKLPKTVPGSTSASIVSFTDRYSISNDPAIPSTGLMVDSKLTEEVAQIAKNSVEHEKCTIFHDTSMEITESVANFARKKSVGKSKEDSSSVVTEITTSGVKTLEFRQKFPKTVPGYSISHDPAIPSTKLMVDSKLDEEVAQIAKNSVEHEKCTIFHDTSMEITESVANFARKKSVGKSKEDSSSVVTEITTSGVKTLEFREKFPKTVPGFSISHDPAIPSTKLMVDSKLDEEVAQIAKNSVEHEKFTIFHDTSMEITESVANFARKKSVGKSKEDSSSVVTDITTSGVKTLEFREKFPKTVPGFSISHDPAIPSTKLMVDSKLDEEVARNAKNSVEHEKFTIFHDTSMEITESVANFARKKSVGKSKEDSSSIATEITTSGVKSLEFREKFPKTVPGFSIFHNPAIPSTKLMVDSKLDEEVAQIAKNSVEHEKCTIFHDTSMEITESVANFARKKSVGKSKEDSSSIATEITTSEVKTLEFREKFPKTVPGFSISHDPAIPSTKLMVDSKLDEEVARNAKNSVEHEKCTIFHDTSMEITESVANFARKKSREDSVVVVAGSTMFGSKAEFMKPVCETVGPPTFDEFDPRERDLLREKWTSHRDRSMDLTEVVRTTPGSGQPRDSSTEKREIFIDKSSDFRNVVGNVAGIENSRKSVMERTKIFEDKSVDFTDIVGNVAGIENLRRSPEGTRLGHDKSSNFTATVEDIRIMKQRQQFPMERTKIFHDKSLEFTAAVEDVGIMKQREKSPTERTKIFHDNSMEFTASVGDVRIMKQRQLPMERTKVFDDEYVDFTENLGKVAGIENFRKSPTEKTKIFHDNSMEFTAAVGDVRNTKQRQQLPIERTKVFHDESVDFTEVVGKVAGVENVPKSPTERTKIFHDNSMEFTAAVGDVRNTKQRQQLPTEKTKIFDGEYVDFTENLGKVAGIENFRKSPTEKTKIFYDEYVDFTENLGKVAGIENSRKSPTEKTKIFHDNSMEFTAAVEDVRIIKQREKSTTERTKIFHDNSMEFTAAVEDVRISKQQQQLPMERTKIFHNKSMEFTAAVENLRIIKQREKSPTERTKIFHDNSMEFTSAVGDVQISKQRQQLPMERTTIFHNESVDFTEVVRNVPCTNERANRESSPGRSTMFNNPPTFTEIVPGLQTSEKSIPDDPRPTRSSTFRDLTEASVECNSSIEKLRHEDSLGPEEEEKNILQNRQPHDVPEVVQKILRAPKLSSLESNYALDARMAIVAKTFVPPVQKPRSADPEPEVRSPLRKRMKSIGNKSIDLTAAVSFIRLGGRKTQWSDDGSTPAPEVVDERFLEETANFRNESMEAESFPRETHSARFFFPSSAGEISMFQGKEGEATFDLPGSAGSDGDDSDRLRNATLLDDASMEITGVIPGIVRAENIEIEENPKTRIFHDQSMEMTVGVSRPAAPSCVPALSETSFPDEGAARGIDREDCVEVIGAVRTASGGKEGIYGHGNEDGHWSDPGKPDHDGKTVLFRDDCMELTGAVGLNARTEAPFVDKENCPIGAKDFPPRGARLFEQESRIAGLDSNIGETRTTVFRDDSMELTGAVRPASNPKERKCTNDDEAVHWSDPTKFDQEGKTVFFRDDGMELTGAVGFNSRAEVPFADKENCPVGAEAFRPRGARLFEDEGRIASKSEWLGKRKCSSSQRDKEQLRVRAESGEQSRVENFGSDDVTGVVAFSSQINDNEYEGGTFERNYRISGNDSGTLILGNESLEMTGVVPWSADLDVNRRSRPAGGSDDLPTVDKIHQRSSQSQVVKGLFQNPISIEVYAAAKMDPASVTERTGTADLEAEIRKLAESFALEDESGFDQATFLRQQARCMEDYEANSTASQDCEPLAQSVRAIERTSESSDSEKSDSWERSPNAKNANASGRDASPAVSQCFSSKSLEELRNRAYSVGKFQPETTGYELTALMSVPGSDDFHRTIMLEDLQAVEPPSFLGDLADSMRSVGSTIELPTESGIDVQTAEGEMPRVREAISRVWEDAPNASYTEPPIPDITETVNVNGIVEERSTENSGERMERKKMHRAQTCEVDKPIYDGRISASEINDERVKNRRRSSTGLTTADEFSSESADGPSEKLRRGESVLPTEGKVEASTKFTDIDRCWDGRNFASSTVIVDDLTRQTMGRFVENSVVLESSLSDELPSAIAANEEENIGASICAEGAAYDVAMEAEASLCKSPFDALQEIVKDLAGRSETIWTIIRFDEKMLALNFFSNSIVLVIHFNETSDAITNPIKAIGFLSQLIEDGTDPGVSLAHNLIMKKVDSASLTRCYRTYEDIPQMLDFVTAEVKLGMDFMFELDRLRNRNVMEIYGNRIIFMVRTSDINAGIILKLTIEIKPFAEINSNDITISCILGSDKVRENDIKKLITNIKRDHRFLRFYMNDVKDYVDLMAETGFSASSRTGCD